MKFRSIKRRTVAALASTAVVAGALVVPTLLAAPAQAASVDDVTFTCTGFGGITYTTDVNLTAEWDKTTGRAELSAELDGFPNGAPPQVSQPNQVQTSTLKVLVDGAAANKATSLTGSTTADFQGGVPIDIPTLSGLASAKGESVSVVLYDFTLVAGTFTFACTPDTVPAAVVVPITFPSGSDLNYVCAFGANKFAYMTDATLGAQDVGSDVEVSVQLENMPNTAPVQVAIPSATHEATLSMTVNGGDSVTATGSTVADFQGGTPVVIPAMSVDVPSNATEVAVVADDFQIVVGGSTTIPCVLASPASLSAVDVTPFTIVSTGTTLKATSATAGSVALAATVTPAVAPGTVEFYEGATKVGQAAAASGAANLALTGVATGSHSYTAKFVPTDPSMYTSSTSPAAAVAVPKSASCTTAESALTSAEAAVTAATAKVKVAKTKVTKAQAKVKKATKAKKKAVKSKAAKKAKAKKVAKANKQLKAAKKALKASKKGLASQNKSLASANNAVTGAKAALTTAC